jgi:hypothetical protein
VGDEQHLLSTFPDLQHHSDTAVLATVDSVGETGAHPEEVLSCVTAMIEASGVSAESAAAAALKRGPEVDLDLDLDLTGAAGAGAVAQLPTSLAYLAAVPGAMLADSVAQAVTRQVAAGKLLEVSGYSVRHVVSSKHASKYQVGPDVAPFIPGKIRGASDGVSSSSVGGDTGSAGGAPSTFIAPWYDHCGELNRAMFDALVQRMLAVVIAHPGVNESMLVTSMSAIPPVFARDLVDSLVSGGLLRTRYTSDASARPPCLLLDRTQSQAPPPSRTCHYFPVLATCTGGWAHVGPPAPRASS